MTRSIVVQKFGGSSVATVDKLEHVAAKVAATAEKGHAVVVVVSAMGDTTDKLVDMSRRLNPDPAGRELDLLLSSGERISISLLAMALQRLGCDAVALTGDQCEVITDETHTNANVVEVRPDRILAELEHGRVVVAAGFQGISRDGEQTTLGRGGSDTTAIALAAALRAEYCDIYSDVNGVYTADPRVVTDARRLEHVDYDSMLELSRQGARVLHAAAVNMARRAGILIRARSTFKAGEGTVIGPPRALTESLATAVAGRDDVLRVRYRGDSLDERRAVMEALAEHDIIGAPPHHDHRRPLDLLISGENITDADAFAERLGSEIETDIDIATDIGSVAVVGRGIGSHPQALQSAHDALTRGGIRALARPAGHGALTCLVEAPAVKPAVRALHDAFIGADVNAA